MTQTSNNFPDCFYRVTVKALCVHNGKLMFARESESYSEQKWELPGGGLDFGEDILTALQREVKEEMGLQVTKVSKNPLYVWTWKSQNKRGLDWYYSCVLAYRVEFSDFNFTPSDECEAIGFFDAIEIQDLKVSGQITPLKNLFNLADFEVPL